MGGCPGHLANMAAPSPCGSDEASPFRRSRVYAVAQIRREQVSRSTFGPTMWGGPRDRMEAELRASSASIDARASYRAPFAALTLQPLMRHDQPQVPSLGFTQFSIHHTRSSMPRCRYAAKMHLQWLKPLEVHLPQFLELFLTLLHYQLEEAAQITCTVPTQPKTDYLSLDKSAISKNQLTGSG